MQPRTTTLLRLRILATTDMHAHLLAWDYYHDRPSDVVGFARVATLIREARTAQPNCLFFDNGDLLEGSPMGEYLADHAGDKAVVPLVHPMIAALNLLQCDAATPGNHEFDYGLTYLQDSYKAARFPVVTANILRHKGATPQQDAPLFAPSAMLERSFADEDGAVHPLRIGVFGLTPPQVIDWNKHVLGGEVRARDMVESAKHMVAQLRAAGADLVIALAHTGLGNKTTCPNAENVGRALSRIEGLDVLILGHEHRVFPAPEAEASGILGNTIAVMPGRFASHLGVIDLQLVKEQAGWRVAQRQSQAQPVASRSAQGTLSAAVPSDPEVARLAVDVHHKTRDWMAKPVGRSNADLHSYFAVVQPTPMLGLIAAAQADYLREIIAHSPYANLPILSSAAPFKCGGRGGPDYFSHVPAGVLQRRHLADLYVHPNLFSAVLITGAMVRHWLELAVSGFAQVTPGQPDEPLLRPDFPVTHLELVAGLTYRIDLSAPARLSHPDAMPDMSRGRIRDLCFAGSEVGPDAVFALATNSFRTAVWEARSGPFAARLVDPLHLGNRDVVLRFLTKAQDLGQARAGDGLPQFDWGFCGCDGNSVTLDTAPAARNKIDEIAAYRPQDLGLTPDGFQRFRLHL